MTTCIPVSSDFLTSDAREAVLLEYAPLFETAGVSLRSRAAADTVESPGFSESPSGEAIERVGREADSGGPLVVFVLTGGTEMRVLELVGARSGAPVARTIAPVARTDARNASAAAHDSRARRQKVLLVAYPDRNSLPASLEVLARLQQDGVPGQIVFLNGPGDAVGAARLRVLISEAASRGAGAAWSASGDSAMSGQETGSGCGQAGEPPRACVRSLAPGRRLSGRRIGLVGAPSDWLVASTPPLDVVRDAWGADVVQIGMAVLGERIDAAARLRSKCDPGGSRGAADSGATLPPASGGSFARSFLDGASGVREPRSADLLASGDVYAALRSFVDELRLDAVTVRCFDLVTGRGATGCLALSRLTDEGVVAGCEGDVVSALAMLWVAERLGQVSWMANPARVDAASNTITLSHCTVPGCMVSGYVLRSHFESGLGAAIEGFIPTGPVTLVRLGGRGLDSAWVAEGEIVSQGSDGAMCRTQVQVRLRQAAGRAGEFDVCSPVVDLAGGRTVLRPPVEAARVSDLLECPLGNHLVLTGGWVADQLLREPPAPPSTTS